MSDDLTSELTAERLYTVREVADWLRVDTKTVIHEIERGNLGHVLVGRQYRIGETDLHAYRHRYIRRIVREQEEVAAP